MRKMYFFIYMTSKVYEFYEFTCNWNEYLSVFPILATSHFVFSKIGHFPTPGRGRVLTYKSVQVFGRGHLSPNPVPDSVETRLRSLTLLNLLWCKILSVYDY